MQQVPLLGNNRDDKVEVKALKEHDKDKEVVEQVP